MIAILPISCIYSILRFACDGDSRLDGGSHQLSIGDPRKIGARRGMTEGNHQRYNGETLSYAYLGLQRSLNVHLQNNGLAL